MDLRTKGDATSTEGRKVASEKFFGPFCVVLLFLFSSFPFVFSFFLEFNQFSEMPSKFSGPIPLYLGSGHGGSLR
jgi:hypothetical protein